MWQIPTQHGYLWDKTDVVSLLFNKQTVMSLRRLINKNKWAQKAKVIVSSREENEHTFYSDMSTLTVKSSLPKCSCIPWNVNSHVVHWTQKRSVWCQPEHLRRLHLEMSPLGITMIMSDEKWFSNIYWQHVLFNTSCHYIAQKKGQFRCFFVFFVLFRDTNVNNIKFGDLQAQNYSAGMQNYKQTSSL